jgi:predicted acylesterase/phospholipase RssA
MSSRRLTPGRLPAWQRRSRYERHLLALTGGGYRGLFSAEILAEAEKDCGPLAARFDMMAGTSVGGILAIGLACGIEASRLAGFIRDHGPTIFRPRRFTFAGFLRSKYGSEGLRSAITDVLGGAVSGKPFAEIPVPLVISAVDERTGAPRLFRSDPAAGGQGDRIPIIDVALSTSAAPTYFPPHRIGERVFVDGGLIANAPDLVVLTEAMRTFGCSLGECHLLSIGTAGAPRAGAVKGQPGKIGWIARHGIVDLIMAAQEELAIDQVRCLRPGTFLRIDAVPPKRISLDDVSPEVTERLAALARNAVDEAKEYRLADWRRFLAHSTLSGLGPHAPG